MNQPVSPGLKTTFLAHAVSAAVFGLLFLLAPQAWGSLSGMTVFSHELYRLVGAAVLAFGLSSGLAYRAKVWESVQIVVLMELLWAGLAAVILLYYLLRWHFAYLYWLPALLMVGFAGAFAYYYFKTTGNKGTQAE